MERSNTEIYTNLEIRIRDWHGEPMLEKIDNEIFSMILPYDVARRAAPYELPHPTETIFIFGFKEPIPFKGYRRYIGLIPVNNLIDSALKMIIFELKYISSTLISCIIIKIQSGFEKRRMNKASALGSSYMILLSID